MIKTNAVLGDYIYISLTQIGATKITKVNSVTHIVEFELNSKTLLSYFFIITHDNKFLLQRIQPYSISHGKFVDEEEIIDFITKDVLSFKVAMNSSNFEMFCKISNKLTELKRSVETMFMDFNVPHENLADINSQLDLIHHHVDYICKHSKKID